MDLSFICPLQEQLHGRFGTADGKSDLDGSLEQNIDTSILSPIKENRNSGGCNSVINDADDDDDDDNDEDAAADDDDDDDDDATAAAADDDDDDDDDEKGDENRKGKKRRKGATKMSSKKQKPTNDLPPESLNHTFVDVDLKNSIELVLDCVVIDTVAPLTRPKAKDAHMSQRTKVG